MKSEAATFAPRHVAEPISLSGIELLADPCGVIYWPCERLLVVSDLHLEKGSSFAERGILLPPYDTAATLARLADAMSRYSPRSVIALGDSFHDFKGAFRLAAADRDLLCALQRGREWVWIAGNHDPEPVEGIGGSFAEIVALGPLAFRHMPAKEATDGEVCGHLHPVARLSHRGRTVSRRCFASDGYRMVMPAFGAFAGGLNVLDRSFCELFGARSFTGYMLGERRLYRFDAAKFS